MTKVAIPPRVRAHYSTEPLTIFWALYATMSILRDAEDAQAKSGLLEGVISFGTSEGQDREDRQAAPEQG